MASEKSVSSRLLDGFISFSKFFTGLLMFVYLILPLITYCYPHIVTPFVFLYNMYCPLDVYYSDFGYYGFDASLSRNFYLERKTSSGEEVSLGAWHLLPGSLSHLVAQDSMKQLDNFDYQNVVFQSAFQTDTRVLFYVHGASGTRANAHRIELYRVALASNLQVFTFDYRGYADSSGVTRSERGAVDDALAAYEWLLSAKRRENDSGVHDATNSKRGVSLWAHSLGTGITLRLLADLADATTDDAQLTSLLPDTVVLESPFHDLYEAAYHYPISLPYRHTPLFETIFIRAMMESEIRFASSANAARICRRVPSLRVLILHAADDLVLPLELGRLLYNAMVAAGCKNVQFIEFPAHLGYGHRHIHLAPEVHQILLKESA